MDLKNFFIDLEKRNIISNCSYANLDDFLKLKSSEKVVYFGIDCTAKSLHIGHLFSLFQLIRFAKENFQVLILLGGLTSKIGDPSDKLKERPQLSSQEINENLISIRKQINALLLKKEVNFSSFAPLKLFFNDNPVLLEKIYKVLDLQQSANNRKLWAKYSKYIWPLEGKAAFKLLNNKQWLNKLSFIEFIGKMNNITVSYLLAKETIKQRINSENGLSFSAFSYSLLQAYDFYYLYEKYNCHGQLGASDQWGNLTTGLKLIRSRYSNNNAFALTWNLLLDKEGKKISKSDINQKSLWLDLNKTPLSEAYDFFSNMNDEQTIFFIKQFTFLSLEQIDELQKLNNPKKLRIPQRILIELIFYWIYQEKGLRWLRDKLSKTSF